MKCTRVSAMPSKFISSCAISLQVTSVPKCPILILAVIDTHLHHVFLVTCGWFVHLFAMTVNHIICLTRVDIEMGKLPLARAPGLGGKSGLASALGHAHSPKELPPCYVVAWVYSSGKASEREISKNQWCSDPTFRGKRYI